MAVQISGNDITVPRDGSFTRNVTIGGTLTYEDVTNIDSVGLVTARQGIEIGASPGVAASISVDGNAVFSGIVTAASFSGIDLGAVTGATGDFSIADKIVHTGDTNTAIRFPDADTITAETGGSERLRIDSSGSVGINESTPDSKVDILYSSSTDTATQNLIHLRTDPSGSYATRGLFVKIGRDGNYDNSAAHYDIVGSSGNSGTHIFEVQGSEKLRIDRSGRVVIGGTSSYIGGAALAVLGTSTSPNTYGSFAIGKIGANPTANTTLANIRLNGGSVGTRRGAEINAIANSNWTDGSSHPTKLTFAVANVNSASATERYQINHYGHHIFTNENVMPSSGSAGTNSFKGLSQHGYQHWGQRQYYSGQRNMAQNDTFDLFSNNVAHDDIIFWLNIKGYHANRTFATAHGTIGGYGLSVTFQSATGVYGSFSGVNIGSGREQLRWTSTSPYAANWWIWGWFSGTSSTGTHTGWAAAQNF